eukprot:TRINITY_DN5823_c0_g2_i1.p1 TRINITY_DN5823_c0_g2~~TRINITY_DN5823_c0_g2_i1.p1  ORF type:complete len:326 (+),score=83.91 TRINITY_DN5823_c0_g2_i1:48-980(+)
MPFEDLLKQALTHRDSDVALAPSTRHASQHSIASTVPQQHLPQVDLSFLNLSPHQRALSPLALPPRRASQQLPRKSRRSTLNPSSSMPLGQYLKQNWETLMVPKDQGKDRLRRPSIEDLLLGEQHGDDGGVDGSGNTLLHRLRDQAQEDGFEDLSPRVDRLQKWSGNLNQDVYGLPKDRVKLFAQARKPLQISKLESKLSSAGLVRRSSFDLLPSTNAASTPGPSQTQSGLVKQAPVPATGQRVRRDIPDDVLAMYQQENRVAHPADALPSALRWMLPEVSQLEDIDAFEARALAVLHASNLISGITCNL